MFWDALEEGVLTTVRLVRRRAPMLSPVMGALILARREWSKDWIDSLIEADSEEA